MQLFSPNDPTLSTTESSHNIQIHITLYPVTNHFLFDDFLFRYISEKSLKHQSMESRKIKCKRKWEILKP